MKEIIIFLWPILLDYLASSDENHSIDEQKYIIKSHLEKANHDAMPDLTRFSIRELVYYFNVNRSFRQAQNAYSPNKKINTLSHLFIASENSQKKELSTRWQEYCPNVKIQEISGDHFSIMTFPRVLELAQCFDKIILNSS